MIAHLISPQTLNSPTAPSAPCYTKTVKVLENIPGPRLRRLPPATRSASSEQNASPEGDGDGRRRAAATPARSGRCPLSARVGGAHNTDPAQGQGEAGATPHWPASPKSSPCLGLRGGGGGQTTPTPPKEEHKNKGSKPRNRDQARGCPVQTTPERWPGTVSDHLRCPVALEEQQEPQPAPPRDPESLHQTPHHHV